MLRSSESEAAPRTLKAYTNREGLDFSTASELEAVQTFELPQSNELQVIPVRRARFSNVYSITIFFEGNHGADTTELFYIGFRGDFLLVNREPIDFLYEAAANPRDHKAIVGTKELAEQSNQHGI